MLELQHTLQKASRWRKTEAVLQLLEKLAAEDGFYKPEMQLVVSQLHHDLSCDISSLPESIQAALGQSYLEAYLSQRVPFHCVAEVAVLMVQRLQDSLKEKEEEFAEREEQWRTQVEQKDGEVELMGVKVREALEKPKECEGEIEQMKGEVRSQ